MLGDKQGELLRKLTEACFETPGEDVHSEMKGIGGVVLEQSLSERVHPTFQIRKEELAPNVYRLTLELRDDIFPFSRRAHLAALHAAVKDVGTSTSL